MHAAYLAPSTPSCVTVEYDGASGYLACKAAAGAEVIAGAAELRI